MAEKLLSSFKKGMNKINQKIKFGSKWGTETRSYISGFPLPSKLMPPMGCSPPLKNEVHSPLKSKAHFQEMIP